ncbi:hypothetical protein NE237_016072 [Protea cynaroides]|uniref:DYW domain-containing protein n=1 Tax=Protea cynaroides TaxID=273540 RepID=A0A9Q0KF64_9MAGN|nr:hypothetical protein NE237_016072 [Protea cynaroides]
MQESSTKPNVFTFATMVKACSVLADTETGRKLHARIEMLGFQSNLVVCTALIDMYGKSNNVDEARRIFDMMAYCNIISWTSMVVAYAQNAQSHDALRLFREFIQSMYYLQNHFMLASVVNACGSLEPICNTLYLNDSWSCKNGLGKLSLKLFKEMLERGIRPNGVTFVGVLHACSHSSLINVSLEHLNSMQRKHGIKHGIMPDVKHYMCAVDMLGCAGRLDEAYWLAKTIQAKPDDGAVLWGTLVATSITHGRLDLVVEAGQKLIELNRQVATSYITVSNTYAVAGKWENVHRIRSEMKQKNVYKEPDCSWIQVKETIYVFYAGYVLSCIRGNGVVHLSRELEVKMKERGYVQGSNDLVFVEVEETKEKILSLHGERLALGFGLITIPKCVTIRIMKNLRMCRACHKAFKLISEIVKRDFVVRGM